MSDYFKLTKDGLGEEFSQVKAAYEKLRSLHLSLDMSRGKPGFDNMDLSEKMFDLVGNSTGFKNISGIDCRNYGGLDGLAELKNLFAEILGLESDQIIVGGNSSLNMMFDTITQGMVSGFGDKPWLLQGKIKFLCPSPGYDRHFSICEHYGIEMITVKYNSDGPDMDEVERLVKDSAVKGMWCVPKYSNPLGLTYSDEVVRRIAALKPAAKDFRIMWDNAYLIHDLYDETDKLLNIYDECKKCGNEDMVFIFTSTSKVTYPGAGVAVQAASDSNIALIKKRMAVQTIGPDKMNHLAHARMFDSADKLYSHMQKHAAVMRPKFDACLRTFQAELENTGVASWTSPRGGYFISMTVLKGCAKRVYELCKEAGLVLTPAGATYPYGNDPDDSNLRIAPSFPTVEELEKAAEVLCIAVKYAALEKLIKQ